MLRPYFANAPAIPIVQDSTSYSNDECDDDIIGHGELRNIREYIAQVPLTIHDDNDNYCDDAPPFNEKVPFVSGAGSHVIEQLKRVADAPPLVVKTVSPLQSFLTNLSSNERLLQLCGNRRWRE